MGIFTDEFDLAGYVERQAMEIKGLENRDLFRNIIGDMFTQLYQHMYAEYHGLEQRMLAEVKAPAEMPDIMTGLCSRKDYDQTDREFFPMDAADLQQKEIPAADILRHLQAGEGYALFPVFFAGETNELEKLLREKRQFSGTVKSAYSEVAATFELRPCLRYRKQVEALYDVTGQNALPWRSVLTPYLYKFAEVWITSLEGWEDDMPIERVMLDYAEFADRIYEDMVPLWNIRPWQAHTSCYPEPCMDRTSYEHRLYASQLPAGCKYLLAGSAAEVRNVRWQGGEMIITCDRQEAEDWEMLRLYPVKSQEKYGYRVYGNQHDESFARNLVAAFGQRIKTRGEIERFLRSFACMQDLELADMRLRKTAGQPATYSTDAFIDYEFRTGSRAYTLELDFRAKQEDYRNLDVISFLTTSLQHYFPEYTCAGRLV
ncbi:hypothetical protein [Selenomonas ruminantium]|uniref:Uncharacterized protein n=1 Tax=Selenomonas ruminantium TaxID=971 RepID=A0A1H0U302_SELRU|nr:hypothetical protein [Selenomonas ruminantium]SDP60375.1 hypothetical protein SAMN05216366_1289 [Selenomonas ruminantium]